MSLSDVKYLIDYRVERGGKESQYYGTSVIPRDSSPLTTYRTSGSWKVSRGGILSDHYSAVRNQLSLSLIVVLIFIYLFREVVAKDSSGRPSRMSALDEIWGPQRRPLYQTN